MCKRAACISVVCIVLSLAMASASSAERLVYWHWNAPAKQAPFDPLLAEFSKENGIDIEQQQVTWQELQEKVLISIAGGIGPDVVMVSTSWFEDLALKGAFADLGPLMAADQSGYDYKDFLPASMQVWKANGKQYALPFDNDIPAIWYHPGMFQKAGLQAPDANWDWNAWMRNAQKLTVDTDADGRNDQYGWMEWFIISWIPLVWANDGDFFTNGQPSWRSDNVREALEFYREFYPKGRNLTLLWDELAHHGIDPSKQIWPWAAYAQDRLGMFAGGAWVADTILRNTDGSYMMDFGVVTWPKSPKGKRATTIEGQGVAVVSSSRRKDLGFRLAKWIADRQYQTVSGGLGQMPVRSSVLRTDAFLKSWSSAANKQAIIENSAYARPLPQGVNWVSQTSKPIRTWIGNFLSGRNGLEESFAQMDQLVPPLMPKAQ